MQYLAVKKKQEKPIMYITSISCIYCGLCDLFLLCFVLTWGAIKLWSDNFKWWQWQKTTLWCTTKLEQKLDAFIKWCIYHFGAFKSENKNLNILCIKTTRNRFLHSLQRSALIVFALSGCFKRTVILKASLQN